MHSGLNLADAMEVDPAASKRWLHRDATDGHTSRRLASYDARKMRPGIVAPGSMGGTDEREIAMKMKRHEFTVQELLDLYDNQMLKANPEYQRGIVWASRRRRSLSIHSCVAIRYP